MASFTDIIPQFNPYVSQQPVQDMVQVGMMKQQQYDTNIQRIQQTMSHIAGLDIIRDVDRQHLQNKMSAMTTNLRSYAAGDFSNGQLTNAVRGMIGGIANDPHVRSGVYNTAKFREQYNMMKEAKEKGKSAPQNEAIFMEDANKWLNSTDIEESFNASYSPYYDVDAKWFEVFKGLHPQLKEEDIPYEQNADGSINYGKTAAAMRRVTKETVSAAQIESAIRARLTPEEIHQLNINARYQFRGVQGKEQLRSFSESKHSREIAQADAYIKNLESLKNASADAGEIRQYETAIKNLEERKGIITQNAKEEMDLINSNPMLAMSTMYKNEAISQFAQSHAWETHKSQVLDNPILKQENWERKFQFDRESEYWDREMDRENVRLKQEANKIASRAADAAEAANQPFNLGISRTLGVDRKTFDQFVEFENTHNNAVDAAQGAFNALLPKNATDADKKALQDRLDKYEEAVSSPNGTPIQPAAEDRELYESYVTNRAIARAHAGMYDEAEEQIYTDPRNQDIVDAENAVANAFAELSEEVPPIETDEGTMHISKDELLNYLMKTEYNVITHSYGVPGASHTETHRTRSIKNNLTDREKRIHKAVANNSFLSETSKLRSYISQVDKIKSDNKEVLSKKEEKIRDILVENLEVYAPTSTDVLFGGKREKEGKDYMKNLLTTAIAQYKESPFSMKGGDDFVDKKSLEAFETFLEKKTDTDQMTHRFIRFGDRDILHTTFGKHNVYLPLTNEIAEQVFDYVPRSSKILSEEEKHARMIQNWTGSTTEDPTAATPVSGALFKRHHFNGLRKFNAVGNLIKNKSNQNIQYPEIRVILADGDQQVIKIDAPVDYTQAKGFFSSLTDKHLMQLVLTNSQVAEDFKQKMIMQSGASEEEIQEARNNSNNQ